MLNKTKSKNDGTVATTLPQKEEEEEDDDYSHQNINNDNTSNSIFSTTISILLAVLIIYLSTKWWSMVEPFASAVGCAACLSLLIHELPTTTTNTQQRHEDHDKKVKSVSPGQDQDQEEEEEKIKRIHGRTRCGAIAIYITEKKQRWKDDDGIASNYSSPGAKTPSSSPKNGKNVFSRFLRHHLILPTVCFFAYLKCIIFGVYSKKSYSVQSSTAFFFTSVVGMSPAVYQNTFDKMSKYLRGVIVLSILAFLTGRLLLFLFPNDLKMAFLVGLGLQTLLPLLILLIGVFVRTFGDMWRNMFVGSGQGRMDDDGESCHNKNSIAQLKDFEKLIIAEESFVRSIQRTTTTIQVLLFLSLFCASTFYEIKVYSEPIIRTLISLSDDNNVNNNNNSDNRNDMLVPFESQKREETDRQNEKSADDKDETQQKQENSSTTSRTKQNTATAKANAVEAISKYFRELFISEETFELLNIAISDFNSHFDVSKFALDQLIDLDSAFYSYFYNHTNTFTKVIDEGYSKGQSVLQQIGGFLGSMVGLFVKFADWSKHKLLWSKTFFTTLGALSVLEKTIVFHILSKILILLDMITMTSSSSTKDKNKNKNNDEIKRSSSVIRARQKAERIEVKVVAELQEFFHRKWTCFFFHFTSILVVTTITRFHFAVVYSSFCGVVGMMLTGRVRIAMNDGKSLLLLILQTLSCLYMQSSTIAETLMLSSSSASSSLKKTLLVLAVCCCLISWIVSSSSSSSSTSSTARNLEEEVSEKENTTGENKPVKRHQNTTLSSSPVTRLDDEKRLTTSTNSSVVGIKRYFYTISIILGVYSRGLIGLVVGPACVIAGSIVWSALKSDDDDDNEEENEENEEDGEKIKKD